ncbi:TPA: coiled-coil domain-containing protein, partial [Enterococcus faecium]
AESETQIDAKLKDTNDKITKANQDVATLNTNIDKANDRIDQTNQQIGDLGKLKKMYSNSIEFGDYDYSGRANLAPNLDFSKFSGNGITMTKPLACFKDHETYLELDSSDPSAVNTSRNIYVPNCSALLPNNTYIMTVPIMINADFDDFRTAFILKTRDGTELGKVNPPRENVGTWQNVTQVFTVPSNLKFDNTYLQLWQPIEGNGKLYIGYDIKIEKVTSTSDTATPYQPNLLDAPYYLSKVALGENIADHTAVFPISTSDYQLYNKRNIENYEADQTYTLTMKATKPSIQSFRVFIMSGTQLVGTMRPVEGKVDEWEITFTVSQSAINNGATNILQVYQYPNTSLGAVKIEWLKLEKGDTRTPNISQFKYFGEGLKDSNSPTDYSWDITPEYAEKALTNTLNLTDPQTALGLKNFKDGAQIDGVDVATVKNLGSALQSGSGLTTIQSDKRSAFDEFSYEFERIGDRVFFHARV